MNADIDKNNGKNRPEELLMQKKEILSLPPEDALERILDSPNAVSMVQLLAEEDFHFLIHDIGLEDSLPLIRLASDQHWDYIIDIEAWDKDRIAIEPITRWFDIFIKAAPRRFIKWFLTRQTGLVEFYLFKNLEIRIREHDQDPSDFGGEFFTYDDVFYFRFSDNTFDLDTEETIKIRNKFLSRFMKTLSEYDHNIYQNVLLEALSIIPSEFEEEAYRLRNVRLAEKGFLPFDEAIGLYQPLNPDDIYKQSTKYIAKNYDDKELVPVYPIGMMDEDNLFTISLKKIEKDDAWIQMQSEFAGLANRIIIADQKLVTDKKQLKNVVKKSCGYINIGLEKLTEKDKEFVVDHSASLIKRFSLAEIFRVGYGQVLELKWQAKEWQKKSWFGRNKLSLSFWGEEWFGVLGGLFIKKPLYFDNYETGLLYRDFYSMEDIKITEKILNEIISFDRLLQHMEININPPYSFFLTYKNLLLTLWARHFLGLTEEITPISINEFSIFFDNLWMDKDKSERKTSDRIKEDFLNWLCYRTNSDIYNISRKFGQTFEKLFKEIESEYGKVSGADLDPRYINLFITK